jgi:hypothetical protein
VLGVIPFSRCSRWIKSRMFLCRSVNTLVSSSELPQRQVQMNILHSCHSERSRGILQNDL